MNLDLQIPVGEVDFMLAVEHEGGPVVHDPSEIDRIHMAESDAVHDPVLGRTGFRLDPLGDHHSTILKTITDVHQEPFTRGDQPPRQVLATDHSPSAIPIGQPPHEPETRERGKYLERCLINVKPANGQVTFPNGEPGGGW